MIFKIRDAATGLFSSGGYTPFWTTGGREYKSVSGARTVITQWARKQARAAGKTNWHVGPDWHNCVPQTWEIVEYEMDGDDMVEVETFDPIKPGRRA